METSENENARAQARSILGPSKETELIQSFVRVGTQDEDDEPSPTKPSISKRVEKAEEDECEKSSTAGEKKTTFKSLKKRLDKKYKVHRRREEEFYTDKDRAAAVVMGSKDIKQSLSQKVKQDRSKALHLPMETDAGTLLALSRSEVRSGRIAAALVFVNKALEISPEDKLALVARSKCHLMLGDPKSALEDAEAALQLDSDFVKAFYQKAEALYFSGEFEQSLMFYHRGHRIRSDLQEFRLGIQKAREAIENTIGSSKKISGQVENKPKSKQKKRQLQCHSGVKSNQIMIDKIYLEKLLNNPDLAIADKRNDMVAKQAEEALKFLENREEFWRQQHKKK